MQSPLAEGRELKCIWGVTEFDTKDVAPRGGA